MKRKSIHIGIALMLSLSLLNSSCIGSFALSKNVLSWNKSIGDKFVNELVFILFSCTVYPVTLVADTLVINSIEFWSGSNPILAQGQKVIDGNDGRYLVTTDKTGYTIESENDGSVVRFDFDENDQSWSVSFNGDEPTKFMTFIDDSHVRLQAPDGTMPEIELSEHGVLAYSDIINNYNSLALK